eukprot:gene50011-61209_t
MKSFVRDTLLRQRLDEGAIWLQRHDAGVVPPDLDRLEQLAAQLQQAGAEGRADLDTARQAFAALLAESGTGRERVQALAERSPDVHAALPHDRAQAHELLQMIRWDLDDDKLAGYSWSDQK